MARPSPQTDRVVALVELLAARPDEPLTLAQVTRRLGVNKSTCHSILTSLTRAGWLLRDPFRKTYRLGPALVALSRAASAGFPALELARGAMVDLSVELRLHCAALAVSEEAVTVLDQVRDMRSPSAGLPVGTPIPLHPPFGSAVLAWGDAAAVDRWLAHVPAETHPRYRAVLEATRRRGYAVEIVRGPEVRLREVLGRLVESEGRDTRELLGRLAGELAQHDEYVAGDIEADEDYMVSAVNAPVLDRDGRVTLVLSLTGFGAELTGREIEAIGRRLADATTSIGRAVAGYETIETHRG